MKNHLQELHHTLREQGVLISFSGKFSQTIIEELGEAVQKYLETENNRQQDIYNIFSIFVEQTQNIKNYCTSKKDNQFFDKISNSCIVTIGKTEDGNFICSGNLMENGDAQKLAALVEKISVLDKLELKKLYKAKLKDPSTGDDQGAGIGLIDIARKARLPLTYSFIDNGDNFTFFTLKAVV